MRPRLLMMIYRVAESRVVHEEVDSRSTQGRSSHGRTDLAEVTKSLQRNLAGWQQGQSLPFDVADWQWWDPRSKCCVLCTTMHLSIYSQSGDARQAMPTILTPPPPTSRCQTRRRSCLPQS